MSHTHDIDNEGPLFDFDSHECFEPLSLLEDPARGSGTPPLFTHSRIFQAAHHLNTMSSSQGTNNPSSPEVKGKRVAPYGASEPMHIPLLDESRNEADIFLLSYASVGSSSSSCRYDPIQSLDTQTSHPAVYDVVDGMHEAAVLEGLHEYVNNKGKARECAEADHDEDDADGLEQLAALALAYDGGDCDGPYAHRNDMQTHWTPTASSLPNRDGDDPFMATPSAPSSSKLAPVRPDVW